MMAGCTLPDVKALVDQQMRSTHVGMDLAVLSTTYYLSTGGWPASLSALRGLKLDQIADEKQQSFKEESDRIPWEELKGKTPFKKMQDGTLSITIPRLDESPTGLTEIVSVPRKK